MFRHLQGLQHLVNGRAKIKRLAEFAACVSVGRAKWAFYGLSGNSGAPYIDAIWHPLSTGVVGHGRRNLSIAIDHLPMRTPDYSGPANHL